MKCPKCGGEKVKPASFRYSAKLGKKLKQYRCDNEGCYKLFTELDIPKDNQEVVGSPDPDPLSSNPPIESNPPIQTKTTYSSAVQQNNT